MFQSLRGFTWQRAGVWKDNTEQKELEALRLVPVMLEEKAMDKKPAEAVLTTC